MPKNRPHIPEAQRQRKVIKEKFTKYAPGRITLQVLGTGAVGAPRSLYVFSDQSRYLFNCGEGTQRLAHEHKMKLAKLEHMFITQNTWNNIGGLPGTALTIQDVGVPQITLHGPRGLDEIFNATRRFVVLRDLNIEVADCSERTHFEDNVMRVKYVPVRKKNKSLNKDGNLSMEEDYYSGNDKKQQDSESPKELEDCTDYYAHEQPRNYYKSNVEVTRSSYLKHHKGTVLCYVCKLHPRPGTLNLDKCVKFGVPTGPLLGKLKLGENVVLPSGVTIHSADVCEPDDPGPVFLVVDCPSEDYLDSFITRPEFKLHQQHASSDEMFAYLVVHFTPSHIMCHPKYKSWMRDFKPSTQHLSINDANTCMGSESVHRIQYKLNMLYDHFFPLLGDKGSKYKIEPLTCSTKRSKMDTDAYDGDTTISSDISGMSNLSEDPCKVNTFCNFHLRPKRGLDKTNELLIKPTEYIEETMLEKGFANELHKLRETLREKIHTLRVRAYPKFLFLGTGSCIPNKTRNTSGILYQPSEGTNILLDCGEGTYGQLIRFYGPETTKEVLCNLRAIFISHLHADHHIGLIGVLQGRHKALTETNKVTAQKILLLAPRQIMTWLKFYDEYFEAIAHEFELVPNDELIFDEQTLFEGTKVRLYYRLGMTEIGTTPVRHCPNAFGVAFTSRDGHKICYSGDTMPSENLINLGNRCDLLIHEATMEDELEVEAVAKMHSTTSQAIEVGKNMNAKYIILTHFSQRYAKLPRFNENFNESVGIAFDNMQVRLDELPVLPLLYPALRVMFAEQYEEIENKSLKRQMKQERSTSNSSLSTTISSARDTETTQSSTKTSETVPVKDSIDNDNNVANIVHVAKSLPPITVIEVPNVQKSSEILQPVSGNEPPTLEKIHKPEILGAPKQLNNFVPALRQPIAPGNGCNASNAASSVRPKLSEIFAKITNNNKYSIHSSFKQSATKAQKSVKKTFNYLKTPCPTKPLRPQFLRDPTNINQKTSLFQKPTFNEVSNADSKSDKSKTSSKRSYSISTIHSRSKKANARPVSEGGIKLSEANFLKKTFTSSLFGSDIKKVPFIKTRNLSQDKPKLSRVAHFVPKINLTFPSGSHRD
ncbi:hypothetical protein FQR65_LT02107 [Abscondita terminalis]|nr:hypothetical protein FQR65_LT02107 [Abscondita terminalis]